MPVPSDKNLNSLQGGDEEGSGTGPKLGGDVKVTDIRRGGGGPVSKRDGGLQDVIINEIPDSQP